MYAHNDWSAIRAHYASNMSKIMACSSDEWAIDPYSWDMGQGMIFMTPIEENFWSDCRQEGLILYPQFPACGYFIDFANPVAMVGIECDGREFHVDKERDERRQQCLEANGWRIYRITGRKCNESWEDSSSELPAGISLARHIGMTHGIKRLVERYKGTRHIGEFSDEWGASLIERLSRGSA